MSSNVYNLYNVREFIGQKQFEKAYQLLKTIGNKCAEWHYLNGISAMSMGYYEEGEASIKKATIMDSENIEYSKALDNYSFYRDDYNRRAYKYNRRRRSDLGGCCCCCCDDCCCDCCCVDDCAGDCMKLWCLDSCCECAGGDLVDCF